MKKRLGILGAGHLSAIVAHACRDGLLPEYELCGILGRSSEKAEALAAECGTVSCKNLDTLLAQKPDIIAEAASVTAVKAYAVPALSAGASLVLLSIGALADEAFYGEVKAAATAHGTRVYLASGAVGGFDVLRTVTLMGSVPGAQPVTAGIHTHKGPTSLKNTPLYTEALESAETDVFTGSAKEAIALLPTKVNVAVASALATAGPQNTGVRITSVPGFAGDDHCITAETDGIRAVVDIYSRTSDIAGWSVVSLLQNLVSPIVL